MPFLIRNEREIQVELIRLLTIDGQVDVVNWLMDCMLDEIHDTAYDDGYDHGMSAGYFSGVEDGTDRNRWIL